MQQKFQKFVNDEAALDFQTKNINVPKNQKKEFRNQFVMAVNQYEQILQNKPSCHFQKQRALKSIKVEQEQKFFNECQPLLGQHSECNDDCLTFTMHESNQEKVHIRLEKHKGVTLMQSKRILEQLIDCLQSQQVKKKNQLIQKKKKFHLNNRNKKTYLTIEQRFQIQTLQIEGYRNSIISGMMNVSTSQVRLNKIRLNTQKSREQIQTTRWQQQWLFEQGSFQSNSILFNSKTFHAAFMDQFPQSKLSVSQFCKVQNTISKPFSFFNKTGKDEETKKFISQVFGYIAKDYKLIFIDECSLGNISISSHKQWHLLGSSKESTQRISSFKYLKGALGNDFFLQYQLFQVTRKAYIFQDFIIQIFKKAQDYYSPVKFVLIMDNCSIHKSKQMEEKLNVNQPWIMFQINSYFMLFVNNAISRFLQRLQIKLLLINLTA